MAGGHPNGGLLTLLPDGGIECIEHRLNFRLGPPHGFISRLARLLSSVFRSLPNLWLIHFLLQRVYTRG
jgi:hypothetical protein